MFYLRHLNSIIGKMAAVDSLSVPLDLAKSVDDDGLNSGLYLDRCPLSRIHKVESLDSHPRQCLTIYCRNG